MTGTLNSLFAATVFFVAGHFLLSSQPLRQALMAGIVAVLSFLGDPFRSGGGGSRGMPGAGTVAQVFRAVYSILILGAFFWMIKAYGAAPFLAVWQPAPVLAWVPVVVMPLALFLVVAGLTTASPTMVGGEARLDDPGVHDPAPGMLRVTRHPFLWGTALWAASHLMVNGAAADIILMGGILVLSLGGMRHIDQRREASLGAAWGPVKLTTSAVPFAAIIQGRTTMDWQGIGWWRPAAALALYAALLHFHPWLFGVSALPA